MHKVFGILKDMSFLRLDRSRYIIGYNQKSIDNIHYTLNEIYLYKKQCPLLDFNKILNAILNDINNNVKELIISGFQWEGHQVWLSTENQFDYKSAYDLAVQTNGLNLPVTFKFGNKEPEYFTFANIETLGNFWTAANKHITDCISEGWRIKDSINWEEYKEALLLLQLDN